MTTITSSANDRVRTLLALQQKASYRRATQLFVVEGQRELTHCLRSGYAIDSLYHCPEIASISAELLPLISHMPLITMSERVYNKVAYRSTTEGIIAIIHAPTRTLTDLTLSDNPLLLVAEGIEKPGNIGAILRTADAAHVDALLLCDTPTDLYNPNIIRSSLGAVFTTPCVACSSADAITFLNHHHIQIVTAQLQDAHTYYAVDMTLPTAIIVGAEDKGLTNAWRESTHQHVIIPMLGRVDSLNVSISTAILTYEAIRQRQSLL